MVESHIVNFKDEGDAQRIDFFDTDVHLGSYDYRFDFDDKKFLAKTPDGLLRIRIHTEVIIDKVWLLLEDPEYKPIEIKKVSSTARFKYWEIEVEITNDVLQFAFAAMSSKGMGTYFGRSGVCNFISPTEKWIFKNEEFKMHEIPDWVYGGVMYQIFPDRFSNGNKDLDREGVVEWGSKPHRLEHQGGDLYGVINKLDYIQNLGVNILYLNPVFLSSSIHRYDSWDHKKVDPSLGGDKALKELVSKVHEKGMKIILDVSLNHVHPQNFAFQDVIKNGKDSKYAEWFTVYDYPPRLKYRPHNYSETHKVGWDGDEKQYKKYLEEITFKETDLEVEVIEGDGPIIEPTFKAWWGVPDMVKVDMTNEGAKDWGLDVVEYWIKEFDIDGWRMDVAKEIDISFWKSFRDITKKAKKNVLLISEIFGDTSLWLQGDMFDSTMNYSFREALSDYFASELISTKEFSEELANLHMMYSFEALLCCQNLLSSHDVSRFLHRANGNTDSLMAAIFVQATFPGIAGIYYGDEIGLNGSNEPSNREAFPWQDEKGWDEDLLSWTTQLMNLKSNNEALKRGSFELLGFQDSAVAYRRSHGKESTICIVNREEKLNNWEIPLVSNNIEKIWGSGDISISNQVLSISNLDPYRGLIISEIN